MMSDKTYPLVSVNITLDLPGQKHPFVVSHVIDIKALLKESNLDIASLIKPEEMRDDTEMKKCIYSLGQTYTDFYRALGIPVLKFTVSRSNKKIQ